MPVPAPPPGSPAPADLVVLDLGSVALEVCFEMRFRPRAPAAVLYADSPDGQLFVRGALAGAGAAVSKSSSVRDLLDANRAVAASRGTVARTSPRLRRKAASRLEPADPSILAVRLAGQAAAEIVKTVGLSALVVQKRTAEIIARFEPVPSGG